MTVAANSDTGMTPVQHIVVSEQHINRGCTKGLEFEAFVAQYSKLNTQSQLAKRVCCVSSDEEEDNGEGGGMDLVPDSAHQKQESKSVKVSLATQGWI
jgi:hypothetical protein